MYRCGEGENCNVRVTEVEDRGLDGVDCTVRTAQKAYRLSIPAPGRHMIYSAAMAAVIGEKLGLSPEEITAGVAHYEPAGERMRLIHRADGALILSDCYNANPQSMAAAIHTLARSGRERTAAVLGDMGELGALSPQAHYDMGMCCAREQIDAVVAIGEKANVQWFSDRAAALDTVLALAGRDTAVLVKASHAMAFPQLVEQLSKA